MSGHRFHDCTDPAVTAPLTASVRELPFLGTLTTTTAQLVAGELTEVVLRYTVGSSGIADSGWLKLCFKYYSDWDLQTTAPGERDYATAELVHRSDRGGAGPDSLATVGHLRTRYDVKGGERPFQKALLIHLEDGFLRPGDEIVIRLGDRRFGGPGTRVQTFVEDGFVFRLYADVLGTSRMGHAGDVALDVRPGPAARLVVAGPRVVRAGAVAPLRVHLEDSWGNAAVDSPAALRLSVGGEPEFGELPGTSWAAGEFELPAAPTGAYRAAVTATLPDGRVLTGSCPVDVVAELPGERAYFADLHVHSDDTVGTQDSAYNFAYGRRVGGLDVLGYTANDFQVTDAAWAATVALCREVTEEGRFVCLPGVEWCGNSAVGGDHNVIYLGADTGLARSLQWHDGMTSRVPVAEHWPITELYAAYAARPDDYLLMPHLGGRRAILDWHHPQLERLIEVHSAWGTGNWFLREAMQRGYRVGVSANSDEHRGRPGSGAPGATIFGGRGGGLTGVLAPELTRAAVGSTLRARRTWATTGTRAVALLRSGDQWMGDERARAGTELVVSYALYADAEWEQVTVYDTEGPVLHRDLHAEAGYAPGLVRVRWGGARHRDRYRWATWTGRIEIAGADLIAAEPWAASHQEQRIDRDGNRIDWAAATFGNDTGVVLRTDGDATEFRIATTIAEDAHTGEFTVTAGELAAGPVRRDFGGAGLHVTVERLSAAALPVTLTGELPVRLPDADSALYLHARQSDGHEVWTSPLFFTTA
ncbi:hypothetical protein EBN03_17715 [Nocardia stercoris]|uniref:DUF3604 domain-containing protein n=1 Tax=Nocardia stercoris TaxID=2483361 RepID=A0A3M2L196_9NOCA|nr:hypothetical protein EBN03_17715 [Nocardia stercoris]